MRAGSAAAPPALAGYEFVQHLGGGGFADVHEYREVGLDRKVAVKVLRPEVLELVGLERFRTEANLMARLSDHPSIIQVFRTDVADDGRPFIVMQLCRPTDLDQQRRRAPLPVDRALSVGVRLCSAVQWAHDAGILHLDIKPANVLLDLFDATPRLTDFGIAVRVAAAEDDGAASLPWSAPERIDGTRAPDERCDVYSLAATVYTLLAGRSPHERDGEKVRESELVHRALNGPIVPTGRQGVPTSLERVLARALSPDPARRQASALELGRELQQAERGLGLPPTELQLAVTTEIDDAEPAEGQERTVLRPLVVVDPEVREERAALVGSTVLRPRLLPGAAQSVSAGRPVLDPPLGDEASARTVQRRPAPDPGSGSTEDAPPTGGQRRGPLVVAALVTVAVVVAGVVALLVGRGDDPTAARGTDATTGSADGVLAEPVPAPVDLVGALEPTGAVFTWRSGEPAEGDRYLWRPVGRDGAPSGDLLAVDDTRVLVDGGGAGTCIEVLLVRADGRASDEPATACVP